MVPPEQTGAPVLGFAREVISPGESVRAVIVAFFPPAVHLWEPVRPGIDLPMYEGPRVVGVGHILWRERTVLPLPTDDEATFRTWLGSTAETL